MSDVFKRYARALFDVANKRNRVDVIEDDLNTVVPVFETEGFQSFLQNPRIPIQEKRDLIHSFSTSVSQETMNLLKLLMDHGREQNLKEITKEYIKVANKVRKIADATVTTAVPFSDEEQRKLADQFGETLDI